MDTMIKKRIKQVKKGDQNAFADIVDLYKDKIYQLCYRMLGNAHEAEDIAQEAFIRAYVNIESFDVNRKFSTWLYRIATNLTIDRIRKKKAGLLFRCRGGRNRRIKYVFSNCC